MDRCHREENVKYFEGLLVVCSRFESEGIWVWRRKND